MMALLAVGSVLLNPRAGFALAALIVIAESLLAIRFRREQSPPAERVPAG